METRQWKEIRKFEEIRFEEYHGIAKITIDRARYRNAFTPRTTLELSQAFALCREMQQIRVVLLTGAMSEVPEGKRLTDVKHAFCSGGDMHVKGRGGYIDEDGVPRLSVLDVQMQIRRLPKPVIAMVNGYAIGGGHVLHLVCDLTIASENAIFGQTGPKVGSFDAGFGSSYLARIVGQKKTDTPHDSGVLRTWRRIVYRGLSSYRLLVGRRIGKLLFSVEPRGCHLHGYYLTCRQMDSGTCKCSF